MSDSLQDRVSLDAYPMADFSSKARTFQFKTETVRVDVGRCSGYWTLADGRKCISEHTADKQSNLYETYFFSSVGLEAVSPQNLFEKVKGAHKTYEHDADIQVTVEKVKDSLGHKMWAVDVCIAKGRRLLRARPPYFKFYEKSDIPIAPTWPVINAYRNAQAKSMAFIVVQGDTGSASWGDKETYRLVEINDVEALEAQLQAYPCKTPIGDYKTFNLAVIDARDVQQPFNEAVYALAADWSL